MADGETRHTDERAHRLMMGALDEELSKEEQVELQRLLDAHPALRAEWNELSQVKEMTEAMTLRRPPPEVWDDYWTSVYRRIERGIGWILASIGAIVLVSYGLWEAVSALIEDTGTPSFIKLATLALIVGLVVLLVSVIREKLFTRRFDPYKDIER